eukprot:1956998-Amphidinium_carterae.1
METHEGRALQPMELVQTRAWTPAFAAPEVVDEEKSWNQKLSPKELSDGLKPNTKNSSDFVVRKVMVEWWNECRFDGVSFIIVVLVVLARPVCTTLQA